MKPSGRLQAHLADAELGAIVSHLILKNGGVPGVAARMERHGLGAVIDTWIGHGTNRPLSVEQLHRVFGTDAIRALAAKAGVQPGDLARRLAQALPETIDRLTPLGHRIGAVGFTALSSPPLRAP